MEQQQLSGIDASFLYLETPETPMHVAGLTYFELPPGFEGSFYQHFRRFFESRLHTILPRCKVESVLRRTDMKRKRFSEEKIIEILRQHQAGAKPADLCRQHGISEATLYNWRSRYGGMQVSDAKRLRSLEDENRKLKKLLAEAMLDNAALKDIASGKF